MSPVKFIVAVGLLFALSLAAADSPPPAPPLLLAERYQGGVDVPQYWASEKLDGVRAHWDGGQLRFRSGNPVPAPRWFVATLPTQALDGELWLGRGTFERLSGIVRRASPDDAEWREVRFMVFELPGSPGTFTERLERMRAVIGQASVPWLQTVEQFRLADDKALKKRLAEVVRAGGEGLMLHRADALYETGRSAALLKVTPWLDDEARVVAHLPGKGKYAGMTGALQVEMPDGRRFALGTGLTDDQRRNPPPVGTQVTYRYRELTRNGIPRFARFLRVREQF
ncbi:MAG: DNA ligase [Candidatus Nitricoxidivorans perseverans]|uniref:DNA ligase n=1 Tax=Candidatus Nitricoxidivorans perseverans TaxID=2975601 RepID=A0AA49FJX2_9PROT|nr:MAG: DNA ligase [Candidatus Nitricoxidivorans perseverans]